VVYLIAVWTAPGQRFEDAVLRAADRVSGSAEEARALDILDPVSVPLVVAVALVVFVVCAVRRRVFLGFVTVGMVAAPIVTTEAFQRFGQRPILLDQGLRRLDQSFPSGHTAVALALMCAVVMAVPYRFRGVTVLVTSLWAASVGVATVTASWHRPSDTIGSALIVVGYAAAAVAVLIWCGKVRETALPTPAGRVVRGLLPLAYAGAALLAFAVAAVVVVVVLKRSGPGPYGADILLAGRCLAFSASAAVAAALLTLLRQTDLGAPVADEAQEGSSDVEPGHAGVHRPSRS
jgi:membrane-associated phospholipid phosphatase